MTKLRGNALVGQSGGPTAVINQSLVGVIEACAQAPEIAGVYGAIHGIQGILERNLIDLGRETRETLEAVAGTPGAALRSVRKKPSRDECELLLEAFQELDVRYFFYIGGNDSAETAHILNEIALEKSYDVRLFHVPKTIDNDLRETDHCPGFGSAARVVACAHLGDEEDNRGLGGVKINVVMGRNAGWLTASSLLARRHEDAGPHLIYVPEVDFSLDAFVGEVDRCMAAHGRCIVALSEGVHDAEGRLILESGERDSHGNVQLSGSGALGDFLAAHVKESLGAKLRVRADTFGYLQRSLAGCVSEVDASEAREVGRTAVRVATSGEVPHGSIVIRREGGGAADYRATFGSTELEKVARVTKPLEERFLRGASDIDPSFLDYVTPLVGPLPVTARLAGQPLG